MSERKKQIRADVEYWEDRLTTLKKAERFLIDYETTQWMILKYWDIIVLVLAMYTALVAPFEVAFVEIDASSPLYIVNRIVDILFVFDIILSFCLIYYDDNQGSKIRDPSEIAKHYLRTWLLIDLLATIISLLDVLEINVESNYFRLLRCVKLLRLLRVKRIIERFQPQLGWPNSGIDLFYSIMTVVLLSHWGACFWGAAPAYNESYGWTGPDAYNVWDQGVFTIYLSSLHWSVMTMTTIGYGDIGPTNDVERRFASIFMLVGALAYASILGDICNVIDGLDLSTKSFRDRMDNFNNFLKMVNIPQERSFLMRRYFISNEPHHRYTFNAQIIPLMSPSVRDSFTYRCNSKWLENISFLKCTLPEDQCDKRFVGPLDMQEQRHNGEEIREDLHMPPCYEIKSFNHILMQYLKPECYSIQEKMIQCNEKAEKLYVITSGVIGSKGTMYTTSDTIGDDILLNFILDSHRRTYSAVCLSFVNVFSLHINDLRTALDKGYFQHISRHIRRRAVRQAVAYAFVKEANKRKQVQEEATETSFSQEILSLGKSEKKSNLEKLKINEGKKDQRQLDLLSDKLQTLYNVISALDMIKKRKKGSAADSKYDILHTV